MRRFLLLSAIALIFVAAYLLTDLKSVPTSAFATGNAYTSTKHGGGTTDGALPYDAGNGPGVDRSVNPDYTTKYYNSASAGAGKYKGGECSQCHEPHASFGGYNGEPPPNSTTGDTASGESATEPWPRKSRTGLNAGNTGSCLNCHTPHGISGSANYANDVGTAPASGNYKVTSTTPTGLIPRQLIAWEEALCLRCHDSDGPATAGGAITTNIKAEVDNYLATAGSGHPVRSDTYYGRHNLANESQNKLPATGWFTATTSHAECTDCHNPHIVKGYGSAPGTYPNPQRATVFQWSGTTSFQPNRSVGTYGVYISPVNFGVWGITVTQGTGAYASTVANLGSTNYVYELCLKCHSYWGSGDGAPGTYTNQPNSPSTVSPKAWTDSWMPVNYKMTDLADEFKTSNYGFHPVFGQGVNTPEAASLRNPNWCNEGTAAYGGSCTSKAGDRSDLFTAPPFANAAQTLSENFVPPWNHKSFITCVDCHEAENVDAAGAIARGPHGSARPFILRQSDSNISYTICATAGTTSACGSTTSYSYATVPGATPNFCLNCHRVDVYSCMGCYGASHVATYNSFARQPHPPDPGRNSFDTNPNGNPPPRGITCLFCHGGGLKSDGTTKLGTIHGSNEGVGPNGTSARGKRLLTGVAWKGVTRSTTTAAGSCWFGASGAGTLNGCTQHGNGFTGAMNAAANYNYDPGPP
ncbi:MAG: hypothetical protein HY266_01650 [Deltaproteobacteria bacterium]|nr:hypothetical protein [Deltaproteobacteria bacterium]